MIFDFAIDFMTPLISESANKFAPTTSLTEDFSIKARTSRAFKFTAMLLFHRSCLQFDRLKGYFFVSAGGGGDMDASRAIASAFCCKVALATSACFCKAGSLCAADFSPLPHPEIHNNANKPIIKNFISAPKLLIKR